MSYISYDVKCPVCGEVYYETTEQFNPNAMTTGEMLRFKSKYGPGSGGYNWSLPFSDYDMGDSLTCVECGGSIAPSGKVKVDLIGPGFKYQENFIPPTEPYIAPGEPEISTIEGNVGDPEEVTLKNAEQTTGVFDPPQGSERYTKQFSCPECGGFFNYDAFMEHLKKHPKEVQEKILKKPDAPIKEEEAPKPEKGKKKGRREEQLPLEPPKSPCPMCAEEFSAQADLDEHLKTHNLSGVTKV